MVLECSPRRLPEEGNMNKSAAGALITLALLLESSTIFGTFTYNFSFELESDIFTFDNNSFYIVKHSSIVKTNDNPDEYFLAFYGQHMHYGDAGRGIWSQTYTNGRWTEPSLLVEDENATKIAGNPALVMMESGELLLFYTLGPSDFEGKIRKLSMVGGKWGSISDPTCSYPFSSRPLPWNDHFFFGFSGKRNGNWTSSIQFDTYNMFGCPNNRQLFTGPSPVGPPVPFFTKAALPICVFCVEGGTIYMAKSDSTLSQWEQGNPSTLPCTTTALDATALTDDEFVLVHNSASSGKLVVSVMDVDLDVRLALLVLQDQANGNFSSPSVVRSSSDRVHLTYVFNGFMIKHAVLKVNITAI